ncbi:bifunctional diaminohydroxyphosphoribosylaminopyrimidine deaminase/5-amino-6-(5-phosphoribosylamino)uracil reductase RibD [Leucobacter triazinivorans]|uniref:Riboflavin biosynthesis protein RibD n=1 Tax=Leucobacter triazinivorans TaxID=1784719 RepID=A0A4P6KF13_9MICO|nr:dihydrofolate reductase family protein [Leucobacter triazinivorans]QBE48730.1 riboflavin biosynthesis protein RibD [Leucobacter triazinivorans]
MIELARVEDAMRRALTVSRRGPADDPNPQVGCVLLDPDGRIVAEGWHRGSGTPHAEIDALQQLPEAWRSRTAELTAVVSLEPCNHTGRTGPCARALVEAGIGAVAYALSDPGAEAGGGAATLRAAGVEVRGGVLPGEARAVLGPWLARQTSSTASSVLRTSAEREDALGGIGTQSDALLHAPGRPHVTVKWAQTLDGRAAAADGSSQWITGVDARADVHRRRAEADTILVGTGTLIADDPALTARAEHGGLLVPAQEQPVPVVMGHRPIPDGARVLQHPALAARGLASPLRLTGDDLTADLAELHARGFRRLFVEGGPAIASSFIAAGLVDEILVYLAPALLGGPRLALGDLGIESMSGIARLRVSRTVQIGADLLIKAIIVTDPDPTPEEG